MSWIKFDHCTPDKPEVFMLSEILGIDPDAVTGKLVRIWIWADQQTIVGDAVCVTRASLDRLASVTGFAAALIKVGWLIDSADGFIFANFDRHNGSTAKTRGLTAKRNSALRNRDASRDGVVTQSASPREEKRREDISLPIGSDSGARKPERKPRKVFVPPTLDDVKQYAASRDSPVNPSKFFDHYKANGWKRGKIKMADWQATFRTWETTENDRATNSTERPSTATRGGQPTLDSSLDAIARFAARHGVGSSNSASPPLCLEANVELH